MSGLYARAGYFWEQFKLSIWLIPLSMSISALILAILTLELDYRFGSFTTEHFKLLRIDAQGARQLVSVISGAMMTITGVVFSISIVTLALASNQFGPKILRNYLRDTGNKIVLGLFVSTFIYGLMILASIDTGQGGFVPLWSVLTCIVLTMLSIGALIYYIHNISTAIQADHIIALIGEELNEAIDKSLVEFDTEDSTSQTIEQENRDLNWKDKPAIKLYSAHSGYIQTIDYQGLVACATDYEAFISIKKRAGHFIIKGASIGEIYRQGEEKGNDTEQEIDMDLIFKNVLFGRQRTPIQDIEFSITQLLQIALRALSPGINDSMTGITCINWLGSSLGRMAQCSFPGANFVDESGRLRVESKNFSFKGAVDAVFDPLRQCARNNEMVAIHLLDTLYQILDSCRHAPYHKTLLSQAEMIYNDCKQTFKADLDLQAATERWHQCQRLCDKTN